jgi:acetylornithine deacetylase
MNKEIITRTINSVDKEAMLKLLDNLVKIPSYKPNETKIAKFLANFFKRRGYEVDLQEVEPGRFQTIATLKGTGNGKSLMYNGHIDMSYVAGNWNRDPWIPSIEGDRFYGAGTFNMKGGVASMIAAAEAIRKSKTSLKGDLIIACVAGECAGGEGTVHMLDQGIRADMAIVTEPFGTESVATVHVGVLNLAIHTYGIGTHISNTTGSIDAIEQMEKATKALRSIKMTHVPRPDLPAMPKLNIGGIIGGRGRDYNLVDPYYISDFCTIIIDVHFVHGQTVDSIVDDIRRTLDPIMASDSDFKYEIEIPISRKFVGSRYLVMEPLDVPKDEQIVQTVVKNHQIIAGVPPKTIGAVLPLSYSGDDTCHLWKAGIPCVLYGPSGGWDREEEPDNYVSISEMEQCAKVLALTAIEVCS